MRSTIDAAGRVVVPKAFRDRLGLVAGTSLEISEYGSGISIVPAGPTARLIEEDGVLVADSDGSIDRAMVTSLLESGRR